MTNRKTALLAAMVAIVCGCAPSATAPAGSSWHKPGVDAPTTARDTTACREAARAEAMRRYPYRGGPTGFGATGAVITQQQDEIDRQTVEAAQLNACMQARGYVRAS